MSTKKTRRRDRIIKNGMRRMYSGKKLSKRMKRVFSVYSTETLTRLFYATETLIEFNDYRSIGEELLEV